MNSLEHIDVHEPIEMHLEPIAYSGERFGTHHPVPRAVRARWCSP